MKPRITLLQLLLVMNWLAVIGWQAAVRGIEPVGFVVAVALLCGLAAGCVGLFCRCFRKTFSWAMLASLAGSTGMLLLPLSEEDAVAAAFWASLAGSFFAANLFIVFHLPFEEALFLPSYICATLVLIFGSPVVLVYVIWNIVNIYRGNLGILPPFLMVPMLIVAAIAAGGFGFACSVLGLIIRYCLTVLGIAVHTERQTTSQ